MQGRPTILERLALDRPEARAWALYDWANSAFWTTVIATVFPTYYQRVSAELGKEAATQAFANATVVALLCVAVMAPVLGALADQLGAKKRFLLWFTAAGVVATGGLYWLAAGHWVAALVLYLLALLGFLGANIFNDALITARRASCSTMVSRGNPSITTAPRPFQATPAWPAPLS